MNWITDYIKFEDVLDKATQMGIQDIQTEPIQLPANSNDGVCIFRATVVAETGQTFTAHGDASDENLKGEIRKAKVRMAETRAIARALRWMTNTGKVIDAELPDYEGGPEDEAGPNSSQPEPPDVGESTPPDVGESTPADRANAKAEFLNRSQSVIAKIDDQDQVAIVLTTCGYDTLDAVKSEDCRRVYYALKEKYTEIEEKRAASKLAAN